MEAARKSIQIIRFVLAGTIVMYLLVVLRLPSSATPNPTIHRALTALCVALAVIIVVIRKMQVLPAEEVLQSQPQDAKALARWRLGYILIYALSLSIALYGLALHFMGFSMSRVAPFLLAGFALILFFGPMSVPNTGFKERSGPILPR